ncbi:MAG: hypothetical protein ACT4PU_08450 [Planctomycetota bacterium]
MSNGKSTGGAKATAEYATLSDVVDAIQDLTRVTIAISGQFESNSDAIRRLHDLSIPTGRIAAVLAMKPADVASAIAKYKKKNQLKGAKSETSSDEVANG